MPKFKKETISIRLPKNMIKVLDDIVEDAKAHDMQCSKSLIIEEALMIYFKHCQALENNKNNKED